KSLQKDDNYIAIDGKLAQSANVNYGSVISALYILVAWVVVYVLLSSLVPSKIDVILRLWANICSSIIKENKMQGFKGIATMCSNYFLASHIAARTSAHWMELKEYCMKKSAQSNSSKKDIKQLVETGKLMIYISVETKFFPKTELELYSWTLQDMPLMGGIFPVERTKHFLLDMLQWKANCAIELALDECAKEEENSTGSLDEEMLESPHTNHQGPGGKEHPKHAHPAAEGG
ncbi:hypothetical protein ACJX0J_028452, partial [Zea mays]